MPDLTDTQTAEQTPPLPGTGEPHAYIAVRRTHSPHADRPEWFHRAQVVPAWDEAAIAYARRCGDTLLPIGPDGDTGTRAIVEPRVITDPADPAELDELVESRAVAARLVAEALRLRARVAELEAALDESRGYAGRAHGQAGALLARVTELQAQVAARDARVAELEAQRDRVTDLFEAWAAEENEHRLAGEHGLAEGLHVAIEMLRLAVHGTHAPSYPPGDEPTRPRTPKGTR